MNMCVENSAPRGSEEVTGCPGAGLQAIVTVPGDVGLNLTCHLVSKSFA